MKAWVFKAISSFVVSIGGPKPMLSFWGLNLGYENLVLLIKAFWMKVGMGVGKVVGVVSPMIFTDYITINVNFS